MKIIDCSTKKYPNAKAIVDDEDFDWLSKSNWALDARGYARRNNLQKKGSKIFMHREIMGVAGVDGVLIDHKNGNPLDNRKENLRLCTNAQNSRNRAKSQSNKSGYKGVSWHKSDKKWQARIGLGGKVAFLGNFDSPEKAHAAYCAAAALVHGEFANYGTEVQS
jgi:hypothetical protein